MEGELLSNEVKEEEKRGGRKTLIGTFPPEPCEWPGAAPSSLRDESFSLQPQFLLTSFFLRVWTSVTPWIHSQGWTHRRRQIMLPALVVQLFPGLHPLWLK